VKIVIAGSSGLIGRVLTSYFQLQGHVVIPLVRSKDNPGIYWEPLMGLVDANALENIDVLINLAGENIANSRWTREKRNRIYDSRVLGTVALSKALNEMKNPPRVWINASAIGYYGSRGDEELTEESDPGNGFLSEVCQVWESSALSDRTRIVKLRIGVVLTKKGGALKKMMTPFKLGLGGTIGSGKQWMSWIDIEDLCRIYDFVINSKIEGAVNAVSPNPIRNKEFTRTLGRILFRPTILPLPAFVVRTIFGEMGEELLLSSTRVKPDKLLNAGFSYQFPLLESSLKK